MFNGFDCLRLDFDSRFDWLNCRRTMIGASDSPGILGVGYADTSAVSVWYSKTSELSVGEDVESAARRLLIGKLIEPTLRSIFAVVTEQPCESPGEYTIFRHRDIDWLGATLDGVTVHDDYGPCPVELKNVSGFNAAEWDGDEGPLQYQVQVQHQLAVTGASHGFLLGLIGGNQPVVKTIQRNERFIEAMLGRLHEFWGYVQRRELPPVDASIGTAKVIAKLYPEDSGMTVVLPPEAEDWDRELCEAKESIKSAEERKLAAENKIKAAMKDATFGECGHIRYSWKTQERAEHVVKASTFRVLRRLK